MSKQIKVMISSRCNDPILLHNESVTFTDVRLLLKEEIEQVQLFEEQLFEVWINEDATPEEGTMDAWEACLKQVGDSDIMLILYNGNAGWAKESGDIGICHVGIYAIDIIYNIQVVFLSDCRDQSSTRHAVQRFFDWLDQSGEAPLLVIRAEKRMRIVNAIAKEVQ